MTYLRLSPGSAIVEFLQSDINRGFVKYVHTSASEDLHDGFKFHVSDGTNLATQTMSIRIESVDDSVPMVTNNGLRAQAGVRKVITEFDLKAVDLDTKVRCVCLYKCQ